MYKIMKNQRKPIIVNSATKLIDEIIQDKNWSLVDAIESIESAYPFYCAYDVLEQLVNYKLTGHSLLFFAKRMFSIKGSLGLKDLLKIINFIRKNDII